MCDYETIESVNDELFSNLSDLVHMPFFRYFQVSLSGSLRQALFLIAVRWIYTANAHFGRTMVLVVTQDAQ
jgi:hypothetical protein